MSTMEHLLHAFESTDLAEVRSAEGSGDVDWLRAAGMVAARYPLALSVWRLVDLGDKRELPAAFAALTAEAARLGITSSPAMTVSHVLSWMLDRVCPACHGRGYQPIPGTPHLSDRACLECLGTGEKKPPWGDPERRLYDSLRQQQAMAAAAISRKMRD